ncbi:hypothetical protein V6N13_036899 [Hibiscus sabdariffa]|uniref:Uncharacterized protein n=1 Tax=Hibiscus sabdariffa TaxID=183260 RepID=A0ABR2AN80_9ROSI
MGFSMIMTKSFTSEFPHVERYFWTMVNQPNVKKILGEVKKAVSMPPVPSMKPVAQPKKIKPKVKDEPKKEAKKEVEKQPAKAEAAEALFQHKDQFSMEDTLSGFVTTSTMRRMLVFRAEPLFKVKGLWLFRGQEIPQFVINECYDMELYKWKTKYTRKE